MSYPKGSDNPSPVFLVVCGYCYQQRSKAGETQLVKIEDEMYVHPRCGEQLGFEVAATLQRMAKEKLDATR